MKEVTSGKPRVAKKAIPILVLFLSFGLSALSHALEMNADPAGMVASVNVVAPQGVKVLAQLPLQGSPATRIYTQWEHGHTYLYIEQNEKQLTAVDITKKQSVRVIDHHPEQPIAPHDEPAEGGPIDVSSQLGVQAGVDNVRDRGTLSVLQPDDPADAQLLRFFGHDTSNLVDRDRRLVFFASPTHLLILEDRRWYGVDYSIN